MARNKSVLESELLEKSENELREYALAQYEYQRTLRDLKKDDPKIADHAEYVRSTYSEPIGDAEKAIKIVRRVFKLRGMTFDMEN